MTDRITLNGTDYIPADQAGPTPDAPEWGIVITRERWNIVGAITRTDEGLIVQGRVITYWGTTKGLAELAGGGPTDKTKLGDPATYRIPAAALVMTIDTKAELWS